MARTIFYLHGFLSAPTGPKATLVRRECERRGLNFIAPDMNRKPLEVWNALCSLVRDRDIGDYGIVASSLGGFYAARIVADTGCRAVLINPAVRPWDYLEPYRGIQKTRAGAEVLVRSEYAEELRALDFVKLKSPKNILLVLSTADEVLDYHEAEKRFPLSPVLKLEDENHAVSGFEHIVSRVVDFLSPQKG